MINKKVMGLFTRVQGPAHKTKGRRVCWGPSSSEGPQKHDLTMFLEL